MQGAAGDDDPGRLSRLEGEQVGGLKTDPLAQVLVDAGAGIVEFLGRAVDQGDFPAGVATQQLELELRVAGAQ